MNIVTERIHAYKGKYIDPFTDFGFKRLFGSEPNKDLLIDFLNTVLRGREKISNLTYLNAEHMGRTQEDRKAIFDLYCENESGDKLIIEVQNIRQKYFKDRSVFYSSFPIQSQAVQGSNWDYKLSSVYTVCLLNFFFDDSQSAKNIERKHFVREVKLLDTETKKTAYDKLAFYYLEMRLFTKTEEQLDSHLDKWLYLLKNLHRLTKRPAALQEKIFDLQ